MEIRSLPEGPGRNERRRWADDSTHVGAGPGEPVELLPLRSRTEAGCGSRHAVARFDPAYCAGVALLRAAAHHRGTTPPGMDGESQARVSADAGRQPVVRAAAQVSGHDRFQPRSPN